MPTDLGRALVTSVKQTVLDVAHRPDLGGMPDEARGRYVACCLGPIEPSSTG